MGLNDILIVERNDSQIVYNTKVEVCGNGFIREKRYKTPLSRLRPGLEVSSSGSSSLLSQGPELPAAARDGSSTDQTISSRSLTRTRDKLLMYACSNADKFHSFITLTFSDNVSSIDFANKCFRKYIYSVTRWCKNHGFDFYYLAVPEFQKRGAVHYHLLTSLSCGSELIPYRSVPKGSYNSSKGKTFSIHYYDVKYWKHGFSSAFNFSNADDNFNIGLYMIKYFCKDLGNRLFGRKKILKSNNLKSPEVYYLMQDDQFTSALNYLQKKGYPIEVFQSHSDKPFSTDFCSSSAYSISQDDYITYLFTLLKDDLDM